MILAVLRQEEPNPNILSFILRLTGILAASETSFQHLQQGEVVFGAFGEAGALGSTLWEDMTIRSGWVLGAYTMLQHYRALDVIFALQEDRSLFVASGASRLLARLLIFSVQSEPSRLLCTTDCDWPACARMIVARVEESLKSHPVSHVTHSLKLLTTLFEHNQDPWTEVLWSRIAETVGSLLTEEPIQAGHSLVELFLSMARSPAFSSPECSLWKLVTLALKNLILTQSGPLALGLLKVEACPHAIKRQALNILLQPMDCISRAVFDSLDFPSKMLDLRWSLKMKAKVLSTFNVLKKVFQATLKWFLNVLELPGSTADFQRHQQFFRELLLVLQKRMCSPSWEVRDSALEYLTLVMKPLRRQEELWQELLSSEVLALAEGLLDDPESYVRASAVKALGQFSLVAGVDSKRPSSDDNGNHQEASSAGTRLLEILTTDTEGFPRRAVIGVFVEWLQEGHPDVLAAPEPFVSKAIQAVSGDLDWEVKVAGLELAKVFAAQTFARFGLVERPYTADCLPSDSVPSRLSELVQTFCRVKLFEFLFGALQDCDRPVCLKACQILLAVKSKICKDSCLEPGKRSELGDGAQPEEMLGGASPSALIHTIGDSAEKFLQDPECLPTVLRSMNLEGLQRSLDLSSDHLEQSPHSLLQDILSTSGNVEENEADCY
ncbi:hypothetical protein JD844_019986 [Phrynosoma platyrhinos]|uniref:BRCA1-associated ATM activator 1 n=1 Tax=Phrynosoma platyrhinos TaxID=52577 RepID=A0ABQ7TTI1_PHRPL|nr:hypothetical protein JD844_019986 [Phrynosoma platyrhinos]